jgi:hypothetical protein
MNIAPAASAPSAPTQAPTTTDLPEYMSIAWVDDRRFLRDREHSLYIDFTPEDASSEYPSQRYQSSVGPYGRDFVDLTFPNTPEQRARMEQLRLAVANSGIDRLSDSYRVAEKGGDIDLDVTWAPNSKMLFGNKQFTAQPIADVLKATKLYLETSKSVAYDPSNPPLDPPSHEE